MKSNIRRSDNLSKGNNRWVGVNDSDISQYAYGVAKPTAPDISNVPCVMAVWLFSPKGGGSDLARPARAVANGSPQGWLNLILSVFDTSFPLPNSTHLNPTLLVQNAYIHTHTCTSYDTLFLLLSLHTSLPNMASYGTSGPSGAQNQPSNVQPGLQSNAQHEDPTVPRSEVTDELESSNQALQLKLQALQKELEQTKAEISAVDHVLEVANNDKP